MLAKVLLHNLNSSLDSYNVFKYHNNLFSNAFNSNNWLNNNSSKHNNNNNNSNSNNIILKKMLYLLNKW